MQKYLLFINKMQINSVWEVLMKYPIENIIPIKIEENCIDFKSSVDEKMLNKIFKEYFYKIGYYNTFALMDPNLDFEIIL
jgi:hypothetical protein